MQDTLDVTARAMKKTAEVEGSTQLKSIVLSILSVCQDVLDEARSGRLTEETRKNSIKKLNESQRSLNGMSDTKNKKLIDIRDIRSIQYSLEAILQEMEGSITSKKDQLEKLQPESSDQTQYKGYEASQKRELLRLAKGQDLYFYWKRYDRQTENITSHFEAQKETAQVLAKLTLELSQLERNLELMSKTSTDLSNVRLFTLFFFIGF